MIARQGSSLRLAFLSAVLALALSGCGSNDAEFLGLNVPPSTSIVEPILSGDNVGYALRVIWRGDDLDDGIAGFQIAVDDTTRWSFTASEESLFAFESAACCIPDTIILPDSTVMIDSVAFGAHALFVRAIDARGAEDPTPARISFNSTTLMPEATITRGPSGPGGVTLTPTVVVFEWQGADLDGSIAGYRYKLDDAPWVNVRADCTSVRFIHLSVAEGPGDRSGIHEFTVIAVDNAGAVERAVDTPENFRRWEAVDAAPGTLCITSSAMGQICAPGGYRRYARYGTPLSFTWYGDASAYGARVLCYAYSFDGVAFSACQGRATRFPPEGEFTPQPGSHSLRVRAFDDAGLSLETEFPFQVYEWIDSGSPREPRVLYIDDFSAGTGTSGELFPDDSMEDAFWDTLLTGFSGTRFDAEQEQAVPTERILGSATTVIWYLDDASRLKRSLGPGSQPTLLRDFVRRGGNLILCGAIPTAAFAPDNAFDSLTIINPGCLHSRRNSYGGPERSLNWYPAFCDTALTFVFEELGIARSFYAEERDRLRSLDGRGIVLPDGSLLPDLAIDVGKRGLRTDGTPILDAAGLELCEQYDAGERAALDPQRGPLALWRFVDASGETKRVCAHYWPRSAARGHVLLLGFSPFFFDTIEMQGVFRTFLTLFGEPFVEPAAR